MTAQVGKANLVHVNRMDLRHRLDQALAEGQLVVVGGDTNKMGAPGGDHFMLCIGRQGSDYHINDPGGFFPTPGTRLPAGLMEQFFIEAIALSPP